MSKLNTIPLDEDGQPLTDAALCAFLDEAEPIDVPFTKRNGKSITLHALVDHTRAKAPHLKAYQRKVQEIAETAELKAEGEEAREALAKAKEESRALALEIGGAEAEIAEDADDDDMSANDLRATFDAFDVMHAYACAEAELLGRIVIETDIPGLEVDPETGVSPEFLSERIGLGPALRGALRGYFFGSSKASEEATGTTENPNITDTSATSEATDDAETTPPIS